MARVSHLVVFAGLFTTVLCCGNMKVELVEADTKCADGATSIFKLSPDFGFTVSDDCVVHPKGCVTMTKRVSSFKVHYEVTPGFIPTLSGNKEICDLMTPEHKKIQAMLQMFQLPKTCPTNAGIFCTAGKTISLEHDKESLAFATGTVKGKLTADHKEAGKSCLNFVLKVSPKVLRG